MANCLWFTSNTCWKTEAQLGQFSGGSPTLWTSGNCTEHLMAMSIGSFAISKNKMLTSGRLLVSGTALI